MGFKNFFIGGLIVAGLVFAVQGLAQDIKFTAAKPNSSQALSDEQQGILAVRIAKASVVNILGVPTTSASSSDADAAEQISGTGFVVSSDGSVVTNNHVVETSGFNYFVVLADGTQYAAQIVGQDKYDDIALLKINASGLTPAKLGDSDALETGQSVFAIGNALGQYQDTVTRGVVSGLGRGINETNDGTTPTMHNWIQTDAAINLGNSGGPLIDMTGQVVGMDTLVDAAGESLGFAVPINTIKDAVEQLKTFGKVSRPFLGIEFATITPQLKIQKNLAADNGALVISVQPGSPAGAAGIQTGDVITAINGQPLTQLNAVDVLVQKMQAGSQVALRLLRGNQVLDLVVILGQLN